MVDIGCRVMQTVTSTLCEQFGPAIREPQSTSNSNGRWHCSLASRRQRWPSHCDVRPCSIHLHDASSARRPDASLPATYRRWFRSCQPSDTPTQPISRPNRTGHSNEQCASDDPQPKATTWPPAYHCGFRSAQAPRRPPGRPPVWSNRPLDMGQRLWFCRPR